MAWVTRGNGRQYYYRSHRVNGKSVQTYCGAGWRGLLVDIEVRNAAKRRAAQLAERKDFVAGLWSLMEMQKLAKFASREALHAAYYLCGFKQTKCHHWKKEPTVIPKMSDLRFERKEEADLAAKSAADTSAEAIPSEAANVPAEPPQNRFWPPQIEETLSQIKRGRRDLLPLLREQLAAVPEHWKKVSDMTHLSIHGWARQIAGDEDVLRESIVLSATAEREQLLSMCKTVMERVIVDRFVIAKIQLEYYDMATSQSAGDLVDSKLSIEIAKRQRSSAYQYAEAIRQLSKIRELQDDLISDGEAAESVATLRLYDPDRRTA